MTSPVFDQTDFQGFADDGVPGSATSKAAVNTGWTQNVDENVRFRFAVEETAAKLANNIQVTYEYNLNGAGWNPIDATSAIQPALSPHYADEDADNVQRVSTGGTFTGGVLNEDAQAGVNNQIDHLGGDIWETESCFTIDSAQVNDADEIQVRCLYNGAVLDVYTNTPTITVSKAAVITQTVNQATETDTAQPVAVDPQHKLVNQAAETDTPQAIASLKALSTGQAAETDAAQPITIPAPAPEIDAAWFVPAPASRRQGAFFPVLISGEAAAAITQTVNQATETDTAQAIAVDPQHRLVGQTTEADLAQSVATAKTASLGQATETDTPQSITPVKTVSVGQASEADTAQAVGTAKAAAVARAAETDAAQAVSSSKIKAVAQAAETDAAQVIIVDPQHRLVGQATETDSAQPITVAGELVVTVNQVTETDAAQPIDVDPQHRLVGQAVESGAAQVITAVKTAAVSQVTETDTSQAVDAGKTAAVGLVAETDLAQSISPTGEIVVTVNQVVEGDVAQSITWAPKHRLVGQTAESEAAQPIGSGKTEAVGQTAETDTSQAIGAAKTLAVGIVTETDLAQPITAAGEQVIAVGQVVESDQAQGVTAQKTTLIAIVTESDTAQTIAGLKALGVTPAAETDTAQAITWAPKHRLVVQAEETDTAQPITFVSFIVPEFAELEDAVFMTYEERREYLEFEERREYLVYEDRTDVQ